MGNYSLTAIFTKEPAIIAGAIRSVLWVLVLIGFIIIELEALAAIALTLEVVLSLFVRQTSTSISSPVLPQGTVVEVVTPAGQPNESKVL